MLQEHRAGDSTPQGHRYGWPWHLTCITTTGRPLVHAHHHHTLKPVPPSPLHLVQPHRPPPPSAPAPPVPPGGRITGVDDDASRNQQGAEGPHYLARRPASAAPRVTGAANPNPPRPCLLHPTSSVTVDLRAS
ncbi:hypothetical protein O3P69_000701 [Scylla paramamosain]|uniref:Uncharacterized protein n=1 Tax=Scylla paramamosain TaxID=85552 RepID=A0AAW0USM2_SCYPA